MADKVDVELAHPWDGHEVEERVSVSHDTAAELFRAGIARPATVSAAKAAGVDADEAATKRK
jgi:hypothetical protein